MNSSSAMLLMPGEAPASGATRAADDFEWPIPPFFQLGAAAPSTSDARHCVVELMNGRVLGADLVNLDPHEVGISVSTPGQVGLHRINLEHVRAIRLTASLSLVRDADAISGIGTDEAHVPDERHFTVHLRDGRTLSGITRGFVKEKIGLFLYLLERGPQEAVCCFIPAQQLADVNIGPLLGSALAHSKLVSDETLAAALDKQDKLRHEKLGAQLLNRGIVSHDELRQALELQTHRPSAKLGELLVETGLVTADELAEALALQATNRERRLGDILVDLGVVTVRQVQIALSDKLGIPFVNVREFRIEPQTMEFIGGAVAVRHRVLPLLSVGESLIVAVENPLAMDFAQEVRFITGRTIVPVMADPVELRLRIAKEYASFEPLEVPDDGDGTVQLLSGDNARFHALSKIKVEDLTNELARDASTPPELSDRESEAHVTDNALVRLVNKIIMEAHAQGASDIHIESNSGKAKTRIRFRKDGDLVDYLELQPAYRNALVSRIKVMAGLDSSEHRHAQDGKIAFRRFGPLPIDLRVAIVPTSNNLEDVVLRILGGTEPLPLDALGLSERDLAELTRMISRSYGLILVCGPTGSGKTTTLHSVLHHLNQPDIKIWTAEDPVEIAQSGLRQVQINARIGWTFASAMRAFLRADPDVIMVGEMRDAETTKIGIEASLTGHLVLSTLHTNSAAESVVRLLDLGMDPFNFADSLIGILSQRLARKLCPHCRKARVAADAEIAALAAEYCVGSRLDPATVIAQWRARYAQQGQLLLYDAQGCKACNHGYKGRLGIYELLSGTPEVKHLIRSHGSVPQVQEAAQHAGMRLLRQDAIEKVLSGAIDLTSARTASS